MPLPVPPPRQVKASAAGPVVRDVAQYAARSVPNSERLVMSQAGPVIWYTI